jgi:UDP-N-acetylglucosamine--N-acetylmuramyl-(pentapeptide) pyrophosphoryl-undecaprenol N-acetylglucosamine transferase
MTDRRGTAYGDVLGRIERYAVAARSPSVRGPLARALAAFNLIWGIGQAKRLLRRIRPAAVVGFGGYPSVPPLVATRGLGIPSVLHEQNAVLGRANRMLAGRASAIATSFPDTERVPADRADRITQVGNPVRAAIVALHDSAYQAPAADGPFRLLVTGGSQGAHIFSEVVPAAIAALPEHLRGRVDISQQCRAEDLAEVERRYAEGGVRARVQSFFDDMPELLRDAHLVICRAGASTVAELAVAGRPAILVPLPIAADDHQSVNGRAFVTAGAATMIGQDQFTPAWLADELTRAMEHPDTLAGRAAAARTLARPHAARDLADLVEGMIPAASGARRAA